MSFPHEHEVNVQHDFWRAAADEQQHTTHARMVVVDTKARIERPTFLPAHSCQLKSEYNARTNGLHLYC